MQRLQVGCGSEFCGCGADAETKYAHADWMQIQSFRNIADVVRVQVQGMRIGCI